MARLSVTAVIAIIVFMASNVVAFTVRPSLAAVHARRVAASASPLTRQRTAALRMADEETETVAPLAQEEEDANVNTAFGSAGFFAPNQNLRLGSSRDQDGKSNIWAIEPKMKVDNAAESGGSNNLLVAGGLLAFGAVVVVSTILQLPAPDSI